jgi:hypothetical protein
MTKEEYIAAQPECCVIPLEHPLDACWSVLAGETSKADSSLCIGCEYHKDYDWRKEYGIEKQ